MSARDRHQPQPPEKPAQLIQRDWFLTRPDGSVRAGPFSTEAGCELRRAEEQRGSGTVEDVVAMTAHACEWPVGILWCRTPSDLLCLQTVYLL